jgi:hypothetical protein
MFNWSILEVYGENTVSKVRYLLKAQNESNTVETEGYHQFSEGVVCKPFNEINEEDLMTIHDLKPSFIPNKNSYNTFNSNKLLLNKVDIQYESLTNNYNNIDSKENSVILVIIMVIFNLISLAGIVLIVKFFMQLKKKY